MLSPFAKFSLSDASDFLNSDDDPDGDNDREKSGSPFEVHTKFVRDSGQNSLSEAEDYDDDDIGEMSCRKRPFSSQSVSVKQGVKSNTTVENNSTAHPETVQTKKRAGSIWGRCPIQMKLCTERPKFHNQAHTKVIFWQQC